MMQTLIIQIEGMHCESCAARLEQVLRCRLGVKAVSVSFSGKIASVIFDAKTIGKAELEGLIGSAGFTVVGTEVGLKA